MKYLAPLMLVGALLVGPAFAAKTVATNLAGTKKEAKKKCLEENPNLKGKDLKACVKTKLAS